MSTQHTSEFTQPKQEQTKQPKQTEPTNEQSQNQSVYDNVFHSLIQRHPRLIIPVINKMFNENILLDTPVKNLSEVYNREDTSKIIADSNLEINNIKYHIECQSKVDKSILIRIFEYSFAIAMESKEVEDDTLTLNVPRSAVLYLRSNSKTPDKMYIKIIKDSQYLKYEIPVLKMIDITEEIICKEQLYFLVPFYLFTEDGKLEQINNDPQQLEYLTTIYKLLDADLDTALANGEIDSCEYAYLKDMILRVTNQLAQHYKNIKERIESVMGTNYIETESTRIYDRGVREGEAKGRVEGREETIIETIKNFFKTGIEDYIQISQIVPDLTKDLYDRVYTEYHNL